MTWHQCGEWWIKGWFTSSLSHRRIAAVWAQIERCRGSHLVPMFDVAAYPQAVWGGGGATLHHMCHWYRELFVLQYPLTWSCYCYNSVAKQTLLSKINHGGVFTLVHIMHLYSWIASCAGQVTSHPLKVCDLHLSTFNLHLTAACFCYKSCFLGEG